MTTILERITEAEVSEWMLARIVQIKSTLPVVRCIEISAHYFGGENEPPEAHWCLHGGDKCIVRAEDSISGAERLRQEIYHNPIERAAEKRDAAHRLLREADEFDRFAMASADVKPNPNVKAPVYVRLTEGYDPDQVSKS